MLTLTGKSLILRLMNAKDAKMNQQDDIAPDRERRVMPEEYYEMMMIDQKKGRK